MKNKSMSQEDEMLGDRAVNFEAGSQRFSLRLHRNVRLQHAATYIISQSMSELQKMGASPCPFQDCKMACNVGRYQFGAEPRNRRTWQKSLTEFGFDMIRWRQQQLYAAPIPY